MKTLTKIVIEMDHKTENSVITEEDFKIWLKELGYFIVKDKKKIKEQRATGFYLVRSRIDKFDYKKFRKKDVLTKKDEFKKILLRLVGDDPEVTRLDCCEDEHCSQCGNYIPSIYVSVDELFDIIEIIY